MSKYKARILNIVTAWKDNAKYHGAEDPIDHNDVAAQKLVDLVAQGWEIVVATPWGTSDAAGIKYVLRTSNTKNEQS